MHTLLIHGLARTSFSLAFLERRLRRAGHHTETFNYFAFAEDFDAIAQRLNHTLQALAHRGPYGVVGHSLGGVLTRAALGLESVAELPHHVVMLGTPNQPPRLAPLAWNLLPFQWFTGQCGRNLTCQQFYASLPALTSPYTIVAGTGGPTGPLSPFGEDINDGIVALSETYMTPHDTIVQVPAWHTFMMNHPQVQEVVLNALAD
ncbi:MAG: lipase family alpha/beta hydrolase [Spirulina sp.]